MGLLDFITSPISSLVGGLASAAGSFFGTQQNNQMQLQLQQQQEAYNTQMSNTAYQRASADMTAAGLNPAMMFGSGSAASSPVAPTANLSSPLKAVGDAIPQALNSAIAAKTANATIDNLIQTNANLKASQALTEADTRVRGVQAGETAERAGLERSQTEINQANLPVAQNNAARAKNVMSMSPDARRLLDIGGYAGQSVSDLVSPVGQITSSARHVHQMLTP